VGHQPERIRDSGGGGLIGMRRRVLLLAAVAGIVAVATAVAAWPGNGTGADDELARRLTATDEPSRFQFDHRAGGTRVLDCFLPHRQIIGSVDYDSGIAVLRASTGSEIARKHTDRVLLHRNLFAEDVLPTGWLELALPIDDDVRAPLAAILGTELAGYLLTQGLPASGRATALATLAAADRIDRLPATTIEGRRSDGYRITVDQERFADIPGTDDGRAAPPSDVAPPTIEVWVDDDDHVSRVTVLPGRREPGDDGAAAGWSIDYRNLGQPLDDGRPSSVTNVGDVDLDQLDARPRSAGCEVPL